MHAACPRARTIQGLHRDAKVGGVRGSVPVGGQVDARGNDAPRTVQRQDLIPHLQALSRLGTLRNAKAPCAMHSLSAAGGSWHEALSAWCRQWPAKMRYHLKVLWHWNL
jgi:hypothetical protein